METLPIIDADHWHHEDFDELNIRVKPQAGLEYAHCVDEDHDFFLWLADDTDEVRGAMVMEADHWFDEIAEAFARRDVNHPDVRFFLEQKIRVFAEHWEKERTAEKQAEPSPAPKVTPAA